MQGDPINLFMKAMISIEKGLITPKQFKGVMTMLNNAIEGSRYSTLKTTCLLSEKPWKQILQNLEKTYTTQQNI